MSAAAPARKILLTGYARRKWRYYLRFWLWGILLFPLAVLSYLGIGLYWCLLRSYVRARYGRIAVTDISKGKNTYPSFAESTIDALRLIETVDLRRFRVVERELAFIVNEELLSAGRYYQPLRSCSCDFSQYQFDKKHEHYEWWLAYHAGLIVHEATHGRLMSLYFPYTKKTRLQIERICHAEQRRFVARLPSERYDFARDLVGPFDETRWHSYWNQSRWQYFTAIARRIWRSDDAAAASKKPD